MLAHRTGALLLDKRRASEYIESSRLRPIHLRSPAVHQIGPGKKRYLPTRILSLAASRKPPSLVRGVA